MKFSAYAAILVCALAVTALADDPLMRVRLDSADPAGLATQLSKDGYDVLEGSVTDTTLDLVVSARWLDRLDQQGYKPQMIAIGRPFRDIQAEQLAAQPHEGDSLPTGYPSLQGIYNEMQARAAAHPDICQFIDLTTTYSQPTTYEGRHLYACKVSGNVAQNENEPGMLLIGNHHAREITTPTICLYALERLTTLYGTDPAITAAVNNWEIWIAPTWNPDGYDYCWTTDNMWRKNRHVFAGGTGVDQNRNYPVGWESTCAGDSDPSSEEYKGPTAGSEGETRTLIAWSQDRHFTKVIDYHSYGQQVLRGFLCHTHPFDAWFNSEATALAAASGYSTVRDPSAEGEQYQWQFAMMGAGANLIETNTDFQPSWASSQSEAVLVWPGILWSFSHPIPLWGLVTDAVTGAPVAANVDYDSIGGFPIPETNPTGRFGRYNVFAPAGTYTVALTATGYDPITIPNVVITAGQSTHLDLTMNPPPDFVYPNGGEQLAVNQPVNVQWTGRGPTMQYQVQVAQNFGGSTQVTESFERAALGADYTLGGNANWFITNALALAGTRSARAGAVANNQTSWMTRSVSGGNFSFWYLVSSEADGDFFNFYIDGVRQVHASGIGAWTQYATTLTPGVHEAKWEYAKNGSVAQGSDTVYVDYAQMYASTTWTDILALSAVGQTSTAWTPTVLGNNYKLRIRSYYPNGAYYGVWNETDATFAVTNAPPVCRGDTDCNGAIGFADIDYFVESIPDNQAAWVALYQARHGGANPPCTFANCDVNADGHVNFGDIDPFVAKVPSSCP